MTTIKLGVIADDFTGASDAASFLVKSGNKTILLTEIPKKFDYSCDCIVIGLKIRSVDSQLAVEQVKKVMDFFEGIDVGKVYYKYCSTFDSTPKGNIGPVMDYLMERMNCNYSILCPALPINGRTVKNGKLYVNGVPLNESPLKNHPLNPMWDAYIPNLMKTQSKYMVKVYKSNDNLNAEKIRCYYVPDYITDSDGENIASIFGNLKLLSGGSGLLEHLVKNHDMKKEISTFNKNNQKAIILCGSCSVKTNRQVSEFKKHFDNYIAIDSNEILNGLITPESIFSKVKKNLPNTTLIYSDGCEKKIDKDNPKLSQQAKAMEMFLSEIAQLAQQDYFNKIIVAGGETSGAVTIKLGYNAFYVGESVAPGVPWLIPIDKNDTLLILKSGNFGDDKFFIKTVKGE